MRASFQAANRPGYSAGKLSFGSAITDQARFLLPFFGLVMLPLDSRNSFTPQKNLNCKRKLPENDYYWSIYFHILS